MKLLAAFPFLALPFLTRAEDWRLQIERESYLGSKTVGCRKEDLRRGDRWKYEAPRRGPVCCLRLYSDSGCRNNEYQFCNDYTGVAKYDWKSWKVVCGK
jgi:hypothetical protein